MANLSEVHEKVRTSRRSQSYGHSQLSNASQYVQKRLFGGTGVDQSDSDEEDNKKLSQSMDASPNTVRRIKDV